MPIVNIVNDYHATGRTIGINTDHFHFQTYMEEFNNFSEAASYTILLTDDAMIAMHYIFDDSGKLIKHNLSYLPDYKRDLFDTTETMNEDANIESDKLAERLSNYLRVDFDTCGYAEYYHTKVHLHLGLFDNPFRIPLQTYLLPNDFLYLVFKYIYHLDEGILSRIVDTKKKEIKLSEKELDRFFLKYGMDTF